MTNKYQHTKENYEAAAKSVGTISDMCRYLGIMPVGSNYKTVRRYIELYEIDTSHFKFRVAGSKLKYKDQPTSNVHIKKKLIRERGHKCEKCNNTHWLDEPITLELEHIDGNHTNNDELNLSLLCPNCHSYTKTWRRAKSSFELKNPVVRSRAGKNHKDFCACGKDKWASSKQCLECYNNSRQEKILWPSDEELVDMLKKSNYSKVARFLGVSGNSVKKRVQSRQLTTE